MHTSHGVNVLWHIDTETEHTHTDACDSGQIAQLIYNLSNGFAIRDFRFTLQHISNGYQP